MAYWVWDDSLKIGIDVIDEQHRRIVNYINELNEAVELNDPEKVSKVLFEVIDYTVTHFSFEEELMEKAGYPISEAHKRVHIAFINRIKDYRRKHEQGQNVSRLLMSDLQLWLTNHIQKEDRDYVPYVNKFLKKQQSWLGRTLSRFFGQGKAA